MRERPGKLRPTPDAPEGFASDESSREVATLFDESRFAHGGDAEVELRSLLKGWRAPEAAGASLRSRLVVSYRQQFADRKETGMEGYKLGQESFGARYALAGGARGEFRPTILEHAGLLHRLFAEVSAVAGDSRLTRAELRRDPVGFASRLVAAYAVAARRALARENVGYGALASLSVAVALACAVVAFDRKDARGLFADHARDDLAFMGWIKDVPKEQPKPDANGAGMADRGHGGGQKQKYEKPGGGGGGGRSEDKLAVNGKLPQATMQPQVLAPDPHPPAIKQPALPTAATIQADPVLFPPDTRAINYGDPKSKATELSSGAGTGGGIGEGTGGGVGAGNGTGYGPGNGNNTGGNDPKIGGGGRGSGGGDYDRPFNVKEVTRRAVIVLRPEPLYTDEARKNQITGTVVLRLVLNANGTVTNVVALSHLPDGLTEKAIEAARRIQFTPAEREGRKVSQYATINYNFNIY
jgi:TonB family protein